MRSRCWRDFARLFAVLAADGEGQRPQARLADVLAALEAAPVGALLEALQRFVDALQRLGLHLDERELDVFLNVGFRRLHRVDDAGGDAAGAFGPDVLDARLHFVQDLATTVLEHSLQLGVASAVRSVGRDCRATTFRFLISLPPLLSTASPGARRIGLPGCACPNAKASPASHPGKSGVGPSTRCCELLRNAGGRGVGRERRRARSPTGARPAIIH